MPKTKTIPKNEQFSHAAGKLTIKSIPGDAHLTTSQIYLNNQLIKNGEGIVEVQTDAKSGDEIFVSATINMPQGSSDFASLSIALSDDVNSKKWDYSSPEPDCDEVIYEVTITLN
jgi:hypothetical protein